jgi:hypothetical protein
MASHREEIKKKRISLAEASLATVLSICTNLPESNGNTVRIINAYVVKADLLDLKEDYAEARKSLESADVLLNEVEKSRSVSDGLKRKVLQRLKGVYEKSNRASEAYYKEILSRLGKINGRSEMSNASRHQLSKELKTKSRIRSKQERMVTKEAAIEELNEEDES